MGRFGRAREGWRQDDEPGGRLRSRLADEPGGRLRSRLADEPGGMGRFGRARGGDRMMSRPGGAVGIDDHGVDGRLRGAGGAAEATAA